MEECQHLHLFMDAQEMQDMELARARPKLVSKKAMEALITEARRNELLTGSSTNFDPIESAMANHPKLTREKAERMAEEFGFL